jgi:uncharacterized iron-regulated membrane protein
MQRSFIIALEYSQPIDPAYMPLHLTSMNTTTQPAHDLKGSAWHEWLEHPEKTRVHKPVFQIHLWAGMMASAYVFVMSATGSLIVFRNQLESNPNSRLSNVVEWVVDLHANLLAGSVGRTINAMGGLCLLLLCVTGAFLWWPGIAHWRRGLGVDWKASFARVNWDLHSALGFWFLLFVCLWGFSGIYLAYPLPFNATVDFLEPVTATTKLRTGDFMLLWLSNLHFGRFNLFSEILWSLLGLVPAVLSFTGIFMCCHRMFFRKGVPLPR